MGEGIAKVFSNNLLLRSLFILLLVAFFGIITQPINLMMTRDETLVSYLNQIARYMTENFSAILQTNYMLLLLIIPAVLLAYREVKRKNKENFENVTSKYYKPKKASKVNEPSEQTIRIVALAPRSYFSGLIERLYREISDVYGNIPLWVRYNINILSDSWSLKNIKASHVIHIYGENAYVQKFANRLNEEAQTLLKNTPPGLVHIYSIEVSSPNSNKREEHAIEHLYPREIKNLIQRNNNASLFSGLGLLSAAILTMLINDLWRERRFSSNANEDSMEKIIWDALKVIKELGGNNQKLEKIEEQNDGWILRFSDYEVSVKRSGFIDYVRRYG